jgi:hypothetical protein
MERLSRPLLFLLCGLALWLAIAVPRRNPAPARDRTPGGISPAGADFAFLSADFADSRRFLDVDFLVLAAGCDRTAHESADEAQLVVKLPHPVMRQLSHGAGMQRNEATSARPHLDVTAGETASFFWTQLPSLEVRP